MDRPSRPSREDYSSAYSQRNDYEADNYIPLDSDIHLASLDEKKRLWWRDAAINGLFIASWYVAVTVDILTCRTRSDGLMLAQVLLCYHTLRL